MPYKHAYVSYAIILLTVSWIIYNTTNRNGKLNLKRLSFYVLPSLFILNIFSLFYSDNLKDGVSVIEHTLSFLIFPVVFLVKSPDFSGSFYHRTKKIYIASILLAILICWLSVVIAMIDDGASFDQLFNYKYSYMNLEKYITLSGIHFSLYIIVAIIFCLDIKFDGKRRSVTIGRIILISLFTIFTLHLGSRMGILIILIVFTTYFINNFIITKKIINLVAPIVIFFIIGVAVFGMPYLKVRIFEYAISVKDDDVSIQDKRLDRWKAGWEVFSNNIVFGVGSGDVEEKLLDSYQKHNLIEAYNNKLNAHNQYLQYYIIGGLLLLTSFLFLLVFTIVYSIKRKALLPIYVIILLYGFSLTESVLQRNKGVVYWGLMSSILFSLTSAPNSHKKSKRAEHSVL